MNTPVREGETIEGSRTMRNRPYPVLKCSRPRVEAALLWAAVESVGIPRFDLISRFLIPVDGRRPAAPAAQAPIVVVVDDSQLHDDAILVLAPGARHVKGHASFLAWATAYDQAGGVINSPWAERRQGRLRAALPVQWGLADTHAPRWESRFECAFQRGILVAALDRSGCSEPLRHLHD